MPRTHLYIPDTQVKEGVCLDHLAALGHYIVALRPEVIVFGGDWADMPSLSSYDVGTATFEGRRYQEDVSVAQLAMHLLLTPMRKHNKSMLKLHKKQYTPEMYITLGNHEDRITRVANSNPSLSDMISIDDLGYQRIFGITEVPFRDSVCIDGVAYSHYFSNKLSGRPHSSARLTLGREHMSCIQGHQQKLEIEVQYGANGKRMTSIIAGAFYMHDEHYKGASGNHHWRGVLVLRDVEDGVFDFEPISISRLLNMHGIPSK